MPGQTDCLMVDTFHQATVTGDHPSPVIDQFITKNSVQVPLCQRHADGHSKPLPQRASGAFDAFKLDIFWMACTRAVQLAEIADVVDRRAGITAEIKRRISQHRAMTSREYETISVCPFWRRSIIFQIFGVKNSSHIGHAHRHSRVAAIGCLDSVHRKRANCVCHHLKIGGHAFTPFAARQSGPCTIFP